MLYTQEEVIKAYYSYLIDKQCWLAKSSLGDAAQYIYDTKVEELPYEDYIFEDFLIDYVAGAEIRKSGQYAMDLSTYYEKKLSVITGKETVQQLMSENSRRVSPLAFVGGVFVSIINMED